MTLFLTRRLVLPAAALLTVASCATVDEPSPPAAVVAPESPPAPKPKPVVTPKPPPPKIEAEAPVEPPTPPAPAIVYRTSEADVLINEFQRLRRLAPADVAREQESARQAFIQSRSDSSRVRYAMTLALPGTSPADEARALETLDPVVRNPASTLNGLAVLLASYVQEQRRLGTQVQALQQKLEALRMLERSLSERRR